LHSGDSQDSSHPWTTWAQPNVSLYGGSVYLKTGCVLSSLYCTQLLISTFSSCTHCPNYSNVAKFIVTNACYNCVM
jgi:hypothetical protein